MTIWYNPLVNIKKGYIATTVNNSHIIERIVSPLKTKCKNITTLNTMT